MPAKAKQGEAPETPEQAPATASPFDELLAQVKVTRPNARVSITEQGNIQIDH